MRARTHANPLSYHQEISPINLKTLFSNHIENIDVEIGFGRGVFLSQYSKSYPDRGIFGIEVRSSLASEMKEKIDKHNLTNIRVVHGNAEMVLKACYPKESIAKLFVFHPDPWLKKRHYKRRVISTSFLTIAKQLLMPSGRLYISTDVDSLWEHMRDTIQDSGGFSEINNDPFWESDYQTHWQAFSEVDERNISFGTFEKE